MNGKTALIIPKCNKKQEEKDRILPSYLERAGKWQLPSPKHPANSCTISHQKVPPLVNNIPLPSIPLLSHSYPLGTNGQVPQLSFLPLLLYVTTIWGHTNSNYIICIYIHGTLYAFAVNVI